MEKSNFTLALFKASIQSRGIARNSRFEISINPPNSVLTTWTSDRDISLRCHTGSMPPMNIMTRDYIIGQGQSRMTPHGYDNGHKLPFTFYNDSFQTVYYDLLYWARTIFPAMAENNYDIGYYTDYIGSVTIKQLDESDHVRLKVVLKEAYPILVDEIKFDSAEVDTAQLVSVTFAYRYAIIEDDSYVQESSYYFAPGENLLTSIPDASEISDTTMSDIAKAVPKITTFEESYSQAQATITAAVSKGAVVTTKQTAEWAATSTIVRAAIATGDVAACRAARDQLNTQFQATNAVTTGYFSNVNIANQNVDVVSKDILVSDPLNSSLAGLKNQYKTVAANQIKVNNDYADMSTTLSQIVGGVPVVIAT